MSPGRATTFRLHRCPLRPRRRAPTRAWSTHGSSPPPARRSRAGDNARALGGGVPECRRRAGHGGSAPGLARRADARGGLVRAPATAVGGGTPRNRPGGRSVPGGGGAGRRHRRVRGTCGRSGRDHHRPRWRSHLLARAGRERGGRRHSGRPRRARGGGRADRRSLRTRDVRPLGRARRRRLRRSARSVDGIRARAADADPFRPRCQENAPVRTRVSRSFFTAAEWICDTRDSVTPRISPICDSVRLS